MSPNRRIDLREINRRLAPTSEFIYWSVLRSVAKVHRNECRHHAAVLSILERGSGSDVTRALVEYCDQVDPQEASTARSCYLANQLVALIKKYPAPKDRNPYDPEEKAIETFWLSERKTLWINRRFRARRNVSRRGAPYEMEMGRMRSFIAYVLGFEPDIPSILDRCDLGPGASIGVSGKDTNVSRKLSANWTVSPGALYFAHAAICRNAQFFPEIIHGTRLGDYCDSEIDTDPSWSRYINRVRVIATNNIAFVPKTVTTHRGIAVEPLLNGFLQKGIDSVMRLHLRRIGIDLSDQSRNSEFARQGSLGGEDPYSTIDLRAASDSLAEEVVRELVPPAWFELLDSTRSRYFTLNGVKHRYSKFCSMGNGFCFPLETLIFAAACHAVEAGSPGKDFLVYGDDIVVRQSRSEALIRLLGYLGFETNTSKTFIDGQFRESCGEDWFAGEAVRPYILDHDLGSVQNVFKFLNGSSSTALRKEYFGSVRGFLLGRLPAAVRFFRPYPGPLDSGIDSYGDEFLHSPHVRFNSKTRMWEWYELLSEPVPDRYGQELARGFPSREMYAILRGGTSHTTLFTRRRETRTKVRLVSHPGATSLWLPAPAFLMRR